LLLASVIFFNRSESQTNIRKEGSKIDVVIIDAGHGGKDPGSTSVSKIHEKSYNLLISKYLEEMLRKNYSDMEVYMTRTDDTFIDLKERGRIANSKKGKLFVSIHCNSKLA
jgi:N-acetylmuramoyl-L-alanine amidase